LIENGWMVELTGRKVAEMPKALLGVMEARCSRRISSCAQTPR
jgi:hypothetical protein